jgi:hypothetical protein
LKLTYHLFGRLIFCYIFAPPIKNNIVMARFILDVANLMPHQIKQLQDEIFDKTLVRNCIATMNCIDETNDNQFHQDFDEGDTNELSAEQIENFKKVCNQ